jgi:hypothetical protein
MKADPRLVMARPQIEQEVVRATKKVAWHQVTCATAPCSRTVWAVHHAIQDALEEKHGGSET